MCWILGKKRIFGQIECFDELTKILLNFQRAKAKQTIKTLKVAFSAPTKSIFCLFPTQIRGNYLEIKKIYQQ